MRLITILAATLLGGCHAEKPSAETAMEQNDDARKWSSLIEYWVEHDFDELPPDHREMAAAFWFDADIQNGGFDQYFYNKGFGQVAAVRKAMQTLGAEANLLLLDQAVERIEAKHGMIDKLSHEQAQELENLEFDDLDSKYFKISPALTDRVEKEVAGNYESYRPKR